MPWPSRSPTNPADGFLPPTNLPITSNNDSTFIRVLAADLDADGSWSISSVTGA